LERPDDLLLPEAIHTYFRRFYVDRTSWDKPEILKRFKINNDAPGFPYLFNYKSAARDFRLIADHQRPVIIPPEAGIWKDQNSERSAEILTLLERIRYADDGSYPPPPDAHRKLQRYTVQIPKRIHEAMMDTGEIRPCCDSRFPILVHPQNRYHKKLGLVTPSHPDEPNSFFM